MARTTGDLTRAHSENLFRADLRTEERPRRAARIGGKSRLAAKLTKAVSGTLFATVLGLVVWTGPVSRGESKAPADAASRLPNIVLILADDLGYGDLSCLNPESKIPTPRMDRAAREGMTFTDAHS
ncbi:MAG: sulfatase-like hydrolase/transferase, partial [Thermogutta sp.]|nr:sulfatase-like hydrolase/transferase [Thermogutta sp.]